MPFTCLMLFHLNHSLHVSPTLSHLMASHHTLSLASCTRCWDNPIHPLFWMEIVVRKQWGIVIGIWFDRHARIDPQNFKEPFSTFHHDFIAEGDDHIDQVRGGVIVISHRSSLFSSSSSTSFHRTTLTFPLKLTWGLISHLDQWFVDVRNEPVA